MTKQAVDCYRAGPRPAVILVVVLQREGYQLHRRSPALLHCCRCKCSLSSLICSRAPATRSIGFYGTSIVPLGLQPRTGRWARNCTERSQLIRPNVRSGSKPEKLNESKCFPLFTQQRTSPRSGEEPDVKEAQRLMSIAEYWAKLADIEDGQRESTVGETTGG